MAKLCCVRSRSAPRCSIRYWVVRIVATVIGVSDCSTKGGPTTVPVNAGAWTVQSVCDALAWRKSKLAECSLEFDESRRVSKGNGGGEPICESECVVKRHSANMWIDYSVKYDRIADLDLHHAIQSWDGSRCRWFEKRILSGHEGEGSGGIKDSAPPLLENTVFFSEIGLRIALRDQPWSVWIARMCADGAQAVVSQAVEDGEPVIKMVITPGERKSPDRYTFTFLPDKDFVTRDYHLDVVSGRTAGKWSDEFHVAEQRQFDAFWMPTKIRYRGVGPDNINSYESHLTALSLKSPTDDEMVVSFPVGTRVIDTIGMQAFQIRPDGSHEDIPYYDSITGRVISPASRPSTDETKPSHN